MYHFTVDQIEAANGCQTCCCQKLSFKPGTINKVTVGYASWAVPIGQLHCVPQFMIEPMPSCPPVASNNMPPQVTHPGGTVTFYTGKNTHLDGDLRTQVTDLEGAIMEFKLLPLYGAKHGKLVLDKSGMFDYDPAWNYTGEERFYCSASDGTNPPTIFEVMIAVEIDAALMVPTPHVSVGPGQVDQRYFNVSFAVTVSPAAQECEVFRLTVLQGALDCECQCFQRTDCFDIGVKAC